ncbi:MAG: hypothetical protein A2W90_21475 [Bacteroidetes bacterium GWF2_42_66]|nr:MAG: hypothetical protein A2W92_04290 [Bacteroidetes bacterium GWA2_42_15]OFX98905.1 MAG: hypothetical protein A2W89_13110 [Bacteroidetes bacterium GWE2_42_39]OFY45620.1 MAG: hypothetical protein A2W90_21475 [Bacteroidetes bacterium GWF2_42_66]HBL77400.1 hypothetical protein [Prolixibacteraceae bacterium]HCU62436.1 hypothetical protein [Prolixibacteraceae bacterium]
MFEINDEIEKYLSARGKVILNACPGSGKTTSVAYKLQDLTKETTEINKFSGVACLSFTNIAKDEINEKFKFFSGVNIKYPHLVSTIDSFINQYILLPNFHLLNPNIIRPVILENSNLLDDWTFFLTKYRIGIKPLKFMYSPSTIQKTISGGFTSNGKLPTLTGKDLSTFKNYCSSLKDWQFKKGILTNEDSSYFALDILQKFPVVGSSLIKRFSYVILDEAQDTSEIHFAIFDRLIELGLKNIEIIGDPCQSLYEWREARPDLFIDRINDRKNWDNYEYSFCRRSEQNIIDVYSKLRNNGNPIKSTLEVITNKIKVLKYELGKEEKAIEKFVELTSTFESNQIVVRGRTMLQRLLGYSVNKNYWKTDIPTLLISAKQNLAKNEIKMAVNTVRKIFVLILCPNLNYNEKRSFEHELKADFETNSHIINFINNLPSFELSLKDWTVNTEAYIKTFFELDSDFNLELKQKQGVETYDSTISKLHNINENESLIPISTIHQVKGKTFDTLMLFLSKTSLGQSISLNDYSKPVDFPNESKRMIYVALSRPRNLLIIAVPDETEDDKLIELFGKEIEIIEMNNGL